MIKICLCAGLYLQIRASVITYIVGKHKIIYWCTQKGMAGTNFLSTIFLSSIYKLEQFATFKVRWNPRSPYLSQRERGPNLCQPKSAPKPYLTSASGP